jgi:hypothetical protein
MEAIFAQVVDVPISYIINGFLTLLGGGVLWQFKTVMAKIDALDAKVTNIQMDMASLKTWKEYKDRVDERAE